MHHTQVMLALHMVRVNLQYSEIKKEEIISYYIYALDLLSITGLSFIQISLVVSIDITQ